MCRADTLTTVPRAASFSSTALPLDCSRPPDLIVRRFVFAFGIGAALAQDADRTETYRLLALFGDVFELVRGQYVDPVPDKKLIEDAVNGMLTGLDPHSAYLNAAEYRELEAEDKGQFSGAA